MYNILLYRRRVALPPPAHGMSLYILSVSKGKTLRVRNIYIYILFVPIYVIYIILYRFTRTGKEAKIKTASCCGRAETR